MCQNFKLLIINVLCFYIVLNSSMRRKKFPYDGIIYYLFSGIRGDWSIRWPGKWAISNIEEELKAYSTYSGRWMFIVIAINRITGRVISNVI